MDSVKGVNKIVKKKREPNRKADPKTKEDFVAAISHLASAAAVDVDGAVEG
jgi:hypothetical protein